MTGQSVTSHTAETKVTVKEASVDHSVSDLWSRLTEGESRIFDPAVPGCVEHGYYSVATNYEYSPQIEWHNPPGSESSPYPRSRRGPGASIFSIESPMLSCNAPINKVVDYCWSNGNHFISDKLANLIEAMDPGSIERRPVVVKARGGEMPFNLVMPNRVIEAVDASKTRVQFKATCYVKTWITRVYFPDGAVFDHQRLIGVHNFFEIDLKDWFWSRELIEAAKAAGVRGVCIRSPGTLGKQVDSF